MVGTNLLQIFLLEQNQSWSYKLRPVAYPVPSRLIIKLCDDPNDNVPKPRKPSDLEHIEKKKQIVWLPIGCSAWCVALSSVQIYIYKSLKSNSETEEREKGNKHAEKTKFQYRSDSKERTRDEGPRHT